MDVTRLNLLGWKYKIELKEGIIKAYNFFKEKYL